MDVEMRLRSFKVTGLFGLFDHEIYFHLSDRVTIIHAPNGYGKTVLLQMIFNFFSGSFAIFRETEYSLVSFSFDNDTYINIKQEVVSTRQDLGLFDSGLRRDTVATTTDRPKVYSVEFVAGEATQTWAPWEDANSRDMERRFPLSAVEQIFPHFMRIGSRQWRDTKLDVVLSFNDIVEKYEDVLPVRMRGPGRHPDWLSRARSSIHCQLIQTQRLMTFQKKDDRPYSDQASMTPTVKTYAGDLTNRLQRTLAESASFAQSLDQTFPRRLLTRLSDSGKPPDEIMLRKQLADLEAQRYRLAKVGLLDKSDEEALIPEKRLDAPTLRALAEYISDATQKLASYADLLSRIELFIDLVNSRFQFKKLSISKIGGFAFEDALGRKIPPESLSSGEQHELVLFYDLIFQTKKDSLILIDEPEISLHIAWQRKFLNDLRRIIALSQMDVVISTHSPQLIGSDIDLTVQLQPPSVRLFDQLR